MKRTRIVALALVSLLALFTACQSANNPTGGTTAPAETSQAPAESTAPATDPSAEPAADPTADPGAAPASERGLSSLLPYAGDTVTFTGYGADLGITEDKTSGVYKIYEDTVGNIDINWELVPFSDFDTKAKLYFNSGDVPDIVWFRTPMLMRDYSTAGLFVDFNKYSEYTPNWNAAKAQIPAMTMYETANGEQLTVHDILSDIPGETWYANMDVLDKYGIAVPTNLEELEAAMQKIKEADPSITPFHTHWQLSTYKSVFGNLIDARTGMYFDMADKTWKHAMLTPESKYQELIALLADYTAKGYFNPEFTTMSDEQTKNLMSSGKWAFTFCYMTGIHEWYGKEMDEPMPINAKPFLPPMKSGVTPALGCAYVSDSPYWSYSVSAKCKNPELAVSWVDAMLSEPVSTAFQWGVEGTSYTVGADGVKSWNQEFLAKGAQVQKDLGIWNILGPRFITWRDDLSNLSRQHESIKEAYRLIGNALKSGELESYYPRATPTLTDEAADEYSQIITAANTKIDENEALFVLGERPLSEWDAYVAEVKAVGDLARAAELYNAGKQMPDRVPRSERNYIIP